MEREISDHLKIMDGKLAADFADVFISKGNPASRLYNERHRIAEFLTAEDHENARRFSDGRSGAEIDLAGIAKHREKMDNANSELEFGDESICDTF